MNAKSKLDRLMFGVLDMPARRLAHDSPIGRLIAETIEAREAQTREPDPWVYADGSTYRSVCRNTLAQVKRVKS